MIDSLCHLSAADKDVSSALDLLKRDARDGGISRIFLCNIPGRQFKDAEGFPNEAIAGSSSFDKSFFSFFPGVNPVDPTAKKKIEALQPMASGIKLHPRIHAYSVESAQCHDAVKIAGMLGLPVILCSFMDGINLKLGNSPEAYGRLADKNPGTKILLAHACGHKILDAMMIAKSCPNIYLDLSFTLLYYRACRRVMEDIAYAVASMSGKRILWGTDHPDRPYAETVNFSMAEFDKMGLSAEIRRKILFDNPLEFCPVSASNCQ